jgi:putative ABC transport system permease protein
VSPFDTLRIAVRALLRNKLRSFLTTLGIIIGVFAVISMVAVGEGAKAQVEKTFASMGSNIIVVLPGTSSRGGAMGGFGSMPTLTWDDLAAIRSEVPTVRSAVAMLSAMAQVQSDEDNWTTRVQGTSPEFLDVRSWKVEAGVFFTQSDVDVGAKVAVLGRTVVDKLYGESADPIGQSVRIKGVPFQIVGVLERKGQSAMGQDNDDTVVVPQSTFQSKIQGGLQKYIPGMIMVSAVDADATKRAQTQMANLLRDRHHIEPGMDDDFSIRNLAEMASAVEAGTAAITSLLASIAAVSLIVGGIGIMNIMLVSVTERTREIGLRMAVGAKPRHILLQFLFESLALSTAGGIVGIAAGVVTASKLGDAFGWTITIRPETVVLAVGFSGLVGVVFGIFPARKASKLQPIAALRYE